jgi:hypothetical protein
VRSEEPHNMYSSLNIIGVRLIESMKMAGVEGHVACTKGADKYLAL